jgi:hypothetical protein
MFQINIATYCMRFHYKANMQPPPKKPSRLLFNLLHRLVPPPSVGLAGIGRSGEPDLYVEFSVKVVFPIH